MQLLELCAYLAPEPVPLDLFTAHADLLPEPLASAAADRLAFTEVIADPGGLLPGQADPRGLQLHRLVQGAIRARAPPRSRSPPAQAH